jgi:RimJ/RimL family protein N-acetyltransferase
MADPENPFRTTRLLFRAVESPDDDAFFQSIQTDVISYQNSNARLIRPQSRKDAATYQKYVAEEALIGVVMCLPPPPSEPEAKPTPIGTIHLKPMSPAILQHRFTELGIDIVKDYQGQGYGTESIKWILAWAFNVAGMHRVGLRAFEWNHGARKLYTKLGFKQEGISREQLYHQGRWWDDYQYGMLDREWREMYDWV